MHALLLITSVACSRQDAAPQAATDALVTGYHAEFCAAAASQGAWLDPDVEIIGAPGEAHVPTADTARVAVTAGLGGGEYEIRVFEPALRRTRRVMRAWEAEGGGEPTHRYRWSADSRLLFVYGRAREESDAPARELRHAYDVVEDRLVRFPACP